jgi:hypothetical protein
VSLEVLENNFDFRELGHEDYFLKSGVDKESV